MTSESISRSPTDGAKRVSCTDFSYQFNAARDFQKVEKKIYGLLCDVSRENLDKKRTLGLLVVLGIFDNNGSYTVNGMRQIGVNPIQKYINICEDPFLKDISIMMREGHDGAIVVNRNGQILGSRIYLVVDDSSLDVPDGCGTRHISAASFSTRDDITAVFTLSEETSVVRTWKNGSFVEQFNPADE